MSPAPERSLAPSSSADQRSGSPPLRWLTVGGVVLGLVLFATLAVWRLADHHPPLPRPLVVELALSPGAAGRADPLIVAGEPLRGDFLVVRFVDEHTVRLIYDSWGLPGVASPPFALPPDGRLRLRIDLPALDQIRGHLAPESSRLRVEVDGRTVLDQDVHHYIRGPGQIYFGENPLGGTVCGPTLAGEMRLADGTVLKGDVGRSLTSRHRAVDWFTRLWWQPLTLLGLSVALARGLLHLGKHRRRILRLVASRDHRWFFAVTAACSLVFAWLVTLGTFNFNQAEVFGSFYDYQAASFLQGRLDVPEDAIAGEAFEARGKLYGYFGPTPALLRLPFTLTGFGFAKLSRGFMLLHFVACLTAAYLILCDAVRALAGRRAPGHETVPTPFATAVLLVSTGLGSTIFFLGTRGLIFHEAILSGISFALWSTWCSLRYLRQPQSRWWIGALLCGIASLHCRPPTGLFALTLLGCTALAAGFTRNGGRFRPVVPLPKTAAVGLLCGVCLVTLNGFAWLKFRTFDAAPLRISRPYMGTGRLENVGGKSFHLENLPYNFYAYVARPNLRVTRHFPWIYHGPRLPDDWFPEAKIDLPDHTVPLPYAMPSLFALATLGGIAALAVTPSLTSAISCVWLAAIPMTLALFAAIATAQRYTGDFCPALIAGAALALAALDTLTRRRRSLSRALVVALTLVAVVVTAALTLHYQGDTLWGVPEETKARYRALRLRVDGWFGIPPLQPP